MGHIYAKNVICYLSENQIYLSVFCFVFFLVRQPYFQLALDSPDPT